MFEHMERIYTLFSRGHICFVKVKTNDIFLIFTAIQEFFDVTCLNKKSN